MDRIADAPQLTRRRRKVARAVSTVVCALSLLALGGGATALAQGTGPGPLVLGPVAANFFASPYTASSFEPTSQSTPLFSQSFPTILFNAPSDQVSCSGGDGGVSPSTVPFTDVVPEPNGSCSTVVAEGNGLQAGVGSMVSFATEFSTTLTVGGAGVVELDLTSDDGWVLGMGGDASGAVPSYVSGPMVNPPAATPFHAYRVVGSYNQASSPTKNALLLYFPQAGTYPVELDYFEAWGPPLAMAVTSPEGIEYATTPDLTQVTTFTGTGGALGLDLSGQGFGAAPGSVTVETASGSTLPFSVVSWSDDSVTALADVSVPAGTYRVDLTDAAGGQSNSLAFTVGTPVGPSLSLSPDPIAPTGSLAAGSQVSVTVSVSDPSASEETVDLTFNPAPGGGSAVAISDGQTYPLSSSATSVPTNDNGQITVIYRTPATLPASGTDLLSAQATVGGQSLSGTDTYTFSPTGQAAGTLLAVPSAPSVAPGGSVSVNVVADLTAGQSLGSWTVDLAYPPSQLTPVGANCPLSTCNLSFGNGEVRLTGASVGGLSGNAVLGSITFQAAPTASGSAALTPSAITLTDTRGNPVSLTAQPGSVLIAATGITLSGVAPDVGWAGQTQVTVYGSGMAPGDTITFGQSPGVDLSVNGAGSQMAAQTPALTPFGDVNGDGQVTAADALCILRLVAGLPATSACPSAALQRTVNVTVTGPGGQSATLNGAYTYDTFDLSGTDGGHADAVDALCALRIVAGLPFDAACPAPGQTLTSMLARAHATGAPARPARVVLAPGRVRMRAGGRRVLKVWAELGRGSLGAWTLDLSYDPRVVRVDACTASGGSVCNAAYGAGTVRLTGASAQGLTGRTLLGTVTVSAVGKGADRLSLHAVTAVSPAGAKVPIQVDGSTVQVRD
jgi:hypothetical protein